jgi:hypothetical protein
MRSSTSKSRQKPGALIDALEQALGTVKPRSRRGSGAWHSSVRLKNGIKSLPVGGEGQDNLQSARAVPTERQAMLKRSGRPAVGLNLARLRTMIASRDSPAWAPNGCQKPTVMLSIVVILIWNEYAGLGATCGSVARLPNAADAGDDRTGKHIHDDASRFSR